MDSFHVVHGQFMGIFVVHGDNSSDECTARAAGIRLLCVDLMTKLEEGRDERKRKLQDGCDLDCHFEQSL